MFDLRLWCYCKAWQGVSVSWMLFVKFRIEWCCLVKHFAFLKNVCYQYVNFVLRVTYCFFMSWWLALNQLSWNALLFSCNLICQLCLRGPSYSSHTVKGLNPGVISKGWVWSSGWTDVVLNRTVVVYTVNVAVTKISSCLVGGELNSKEAFFILFSFSFLRK